MKKKLPSIIVNCGDPAGIGLDLIVFLAYKKFPAFLTILANKKALIERSKIHQKKISFNKNLAPHMGDGSLFLKDVSYPKRVVPGKPNKENSHAQLTMIDYAVENCLKKNYSALVSLIFFALLILYLAIGFWSISFFCSTSSFKKSSS